MELTKQANKMMKVAEARNRDRVNGLLNDLLTNRYFDGLPLDRMFDMLRTYGFSVTEENLLGVYCGREGRVHEQVGPSTWFAMTWFRMDSGRYEVVAYLS